MQNLKVSPWAFTDNVPPSVLGKSTQWVALTRPAATAVAFDQLVEPWFATFAGRRSRCEFQRDGASALDGVAALKAQGVEPESSRWPLVAQLQVAGYLPVPFTFGAPATGCGRRVSAGTLPLRGACALGV